MFTLPHLKDNGPEVSSDPNESSFIPSCPARACKLAAFPNESKRFLEGFEKSFRSRSTERHASMRTHEGRSSLVDLRIRAF